MRTAKELMKHELALQTGVLVEEFKIIEDTNWVGTFYARTNAGMFVFEYAGIDQHDRPIVKIWRVDLQKLTVFKY